MTNSVKIIFDVNIWISAFISLRIEQQIRMLISQNNVEIIACNELIIELEQTLLRPKFRKYLAVFCFYSINFLNSVNFDSENSSCTHLQLMLIMYHC